MLYEIECEKFVERKKGVFVPRGRIRFHEGLNTVLGDKQTENSIGKSTFLLALDFCFGGDDYLDNKINNTLGFVGNHTINFAFRFNGTIEYYKRSTLNPKVVIPCNEDYEQNSNSIGIKDFMRQLKKSYWLEDTQSTWRSIAGRYSRIYGRDNYDERRPLKYGDEKAELAIMTLEQLFGIDDFFQNYEDSYKEMRKRQNVRKQAADIGEILTIATTKRQVKENERKIKLLEKELAELTDKEDRDIAAQDTANLDKVSKIAGQITVLKRERTRMISQLNAVKANLEGGFTPTSDDIIELQEYFPQADIKKLETIENFHRKMQSILSSEMTDEIGRLEILIAAASEEIQKLEDEQRRLGVPTNVSKKFIDKVVELRSRISFLQQQNSGYSDTQTLKADIEIVKERMESVRKVQLDELETMINQAMERLNDFIYGKEQYAPEIHFGITKTGKLSYKFKCEFNTGTGDNYKNLIIYDLSVLNNSNLPFLIHDSLIFKSVADLPIDKIMQLYTQSRKQIFISFDKAEAFTEYTAKTLRDTKVVDLYANGGELFGWSWARKKRGSKK